MVDMHKLMERLYPLCRSLTGNGNRATLAVLKETVDGLRTYEIPTGSRVGDWIVPDEWNCKGGWIKDESGTRIVDFTESNLHVMGYSTPTDAWLTLDELKPHLYSLPDHPDWVPYVTSYYQRRWGFCLADKVLKKLKPGRYHAFIDSTLEPGSLTLADAVLTGETQEEIFFSTYICHPSMANNELSGPCVAAALYDWLKDLPRRRYTSRFAFAPETIGAIAYISRNLQALKAYVAAGFNLTCVGDDRAWSYMPSRRGNTLADRVALNMLRAQHPDFTAYSYLQRGSDERQYCAPGVDLPFCSVMRSKYAAYPEYHTSADDLSLVTADGLAGTLAFFQDVIGVLESNATYRTTTVGEPQLGRRGLYPTLSYFGSIGEAVRNMMNLLSYADGTLDIIGISDAIGVSAKALAHMACQLEREGLLERMS